MSAIFSKSCEYGIQAVLYLAKNSTDGAPVQLRSISGALKIPHYFLSKVLQTLSRDEIVVSHKGLHGGFALGRHPSRITLMDVAVAIDGKAFLDRCVLGYSKCSEESSCPAHRDWEPAKTLILKMMQNKSFYDMSEAVNPALDRLDAVARMNFQTHTATLPQSKA